MTGYVGMSAIDSVANDPMALKALYSQNYYQLLAAQQASQAQTQSTFQAVQPEGLRDATYVAPIADNNTAFKGSYSTASGDSDSGIGTFLTGTAITLGAAALLYASYRKGGNSWKNIPNGFKEVCKTSWNWAKGLVGKGEKNFVDKAGETLKEYTINKDGVKILMKDGGVKEIITRDKQTITDASKISKWLKDNGKIGNMIDKLDVSGKLPKGVSLSYTKEVKNGKDLYRMVVENGEVKKAYGKDKAGKWVEVAEDQFKAFLKNHSAQVKEAETLTKTLKGQTVKLADGTTKKGALTLSVRNGKVTEAFIDSRKLTDKEIALLKKDFGSVISQFGKENGSVYGLKDFEYIYRTSENAKKGIIGGQEFRFRTNVSGHTGKNWVTGANVIDSRPITGTNEIRQYLEKNSVMDSAIKSIQGGKSVEGFWLSDAVLIASNGNKYTINPNTKKVLSIEFADGKVKKGAAIADWLKVAEHKNEYDSILALVK